MLKKFLCQSRHLSTRAELNTYTLNPNFAVRMSPAFSLGLGISYMNSDVAFEQKVNASALLGGPADDIISKLEGKGSAWGYNIGGLFELTDDVRIGISYRSRIKVDYEGSAAFSVPADASPLSALFIDQDISSEIIFPSVAVIGISTAVNDNLELELDADWTDWSAYDSLIISYENGAETIATKDYKDAWTIHLGGRYRASKDAVIRFGYYYDMTPVPPESVDPLLPDADKHGLCLGMKYGFSNAAFNIGYQAVFYQDRRTSEHTDGFNGEYKSMVHPAGASAQYYF